MHCLPAAEGEPCTCPPHSMPLCRVNALCRTMQDEEYWEEADEAAEDPELWGEDQEREEGEVAALDLAEEAGALDQGKERAGAQARAPPKLLPFSKALSRVRAR